MSKVLSITVIGARNLPRLGDTNDFTDKYCTVKIGETKLKTVSMTSAPQNVSWKENLQFPWEEIMKDPDEDIIVGVFVKWTLSSDFLGDVRLPLAQHKEVPRKLAKEHWYPFGTGGGIKKDFPGYTRVGEVGVIIGVSEEEDARDTRGPISADDAYYDDKGADEIYLEANEIAKENKAAVQRMIKITEQTKVIGDGALKTLNEQGGQIKEAEDDIEIIHHQITVGETKLKHVDSCCCCCCYDCCTGEQDEALQKQLKEQAQRAEKSEEERNKLKEQTNLEKMEMDRAKEKNRKYKKKSNASARTKAELLTQEEEFDKHTKEIDEGLDVVHDHVKDLKQIALDMNKELDKQNEALSNLSANADAEIARLHKVTDDTNKLL